MVLRSRLLKNRVQKSVYEIGYLKYLSSRRLTFSKEDLWKVLSHIHRIGRILLILLRVLIETMSRKKLTPVMEQYLEVKKKHPERLVFFRIGDFYELFFEDAEKAAELLDITLTARGQADDKIPMSGVPYHSAQGYLKKLIDKGESVVICEQVETDNNSGPGPMKREVSQIITPGTAIEDEYLCKKSRNYIASLFFHKKEAAVSWCDLCSGIVFWQSGTLEECIHRLEVLNPNEVVVSENKVPSLDSLTTQVSKRPFWEFSIDENLPTVLDTLQLKTVGALGIESSTALSAVIGLIKYCLTNTQTPSLIKTCQQYYPDSELILDGQTRKHLELDLFHSEHSLFSLLNKTLTHSGSRLFQDVFSNPTRKQSELDFRHQLTNFWLENPDIGQIFEQKMKGLNDIERSIAKMAKGSITPKGFGDFIKSVKVLIDCQEELWDKCEVISIDTSTVKNTIHSVFKTLNTELPRTMKEGKIFIATCDEKLHYWKNLLENQDQLLEQYHEKVQSLCSFPVKTSFNKVHGFYIEVARSQASKVPEFFIRKQTLKNVERYITEDLKQFEEDMLASQEKVIELEQGLFNKTLSDILALRHNLDKIIEQLSLLDLGYSFSQSATELNLVQPSFSQEKTIDIEGGRHLQVEHFQDDKFIENSMLVSKEKRFLLLTGPNMGGKSTYMRQQAVIIFLSHIGSFVPAGRATIGVCDRIFTRIGASDKISQGQSTFMIEMIETAQILKQATEHSFVIMDEVGRGTSTFDGMAIAKALCEHLINSIKCYCLFATHYHDLIDLSKSYPSIILAHMNCIVDNESVYFTYKIREGACYKSFGVNVAALAGIPSSILQKARLYQAEYQAQHKKSNNNLDQIKKTITSVDLNDISPKQAHAILEKLQLEQITT